MLFENPQIELEQLPRAEASAFKPLERPYLTLSMISATITVGFLLVGGTILAFVLSFPFWLKVLIVAGVMVLGTLILIMTWLGFPRKGYALRDRDVIYKSGLIWRGVTTLPFNRVQHCEVNQGPIEKSFGLARLKVFTAGGQGSDLVIPGLKSETAHQLKDFILKKTTDEPES